MRSKLVYPGGWIRTTYAHAVFGSDALQPCVECGRATCATVWIHEYDGEYADDLHSAPPERRVVRCKSHPPVEAVEWDVKAAPSIDGAWSRRS